MSGRNASETIEPRNNQRRERPRKLFMSEGGILEVGKEVGEITRAHRGLSVRHDTRWK